MRRWQQGRKTAPDSNPPPEKLPPGKRGHLEKHGGGLLGGKRNRAAEIRWDIKAQAGGLAGAVAI